MNKKIAAVLPLLFLCAPLSAAGPELFYSAGRSVTASAGTYTTGPGSSAAYFIEPGIVVFAFENSSFTAGKKGINLRSGRLYLENFSKQPMIPVKSGKMEVITAGRAFEISAVEKSLEAVKGMTSLKFADMEASLPEGRKFRNGKIEQGAAAMPYQGYIAACELETEGAGLEGFAAGMLNFIRPGIIKKMEISEKSGDSEINVKIKASVKGGAYTLSGIASPSNGSQPVMIFSEGTGEGPALIRIAQAAAKEITAAVYDVEKRAFLEGRQVAVVFDTVDGSVIEETEEVLKILPGIKKIEKANLYGKKTIIKLTTRADGYMTADMIRSRIEGLKPEKALKNRVIF